jgi:hypothetical protein
MAKITHFDILEPENPEKYRHHWGSTKVFQPSQGAAALQRLLLLAKDPGGVLGLTTKKGFLTP